MHTGGIFHQVDDTHKIVGALNPENFGALAGKLYDAGQNTDMVAFMNAHTKHAVNSFADGSIRYVSTDNVLGLNFDRYVSAFGSFTFIDADFIKGNDILLINQSL